MVVSLGSSRFLALAAALLVERITVLSPVRMAAVCSALAVATDC